MTLPETTPILLCYDRSDGSRHAIETAARVFPGHTAIVLHIWSPIAIMASVYGGGVLMPVYDDSALQEAAATVADEGVALATGAGLSARAQTTESAYEGTWHAILEVADECDAGIIVLGARGLSTFKSIVLGSVSHGVAQHSRRPVLIVPPAASPA